MTEFKRASNETTDDLKDKGQSGWKDVPESTQTFIAFSDAFAQNFPRANFSIRSNRPASM